MHAAAVRGRRQAQDPEARLEEVHAELTRLARSKGAYDAEEARWLLEGKRGLVVGVAASIVLIPGAPLVPILFVTPLVTFSLNRQWVFR